MSDEVTKKPTEQPTQKLKINGMPDHLKVIEPMDLTTEISGIDLGTPWFRIGSWTKDSSIKVGPLNEVEERYALLINKGDFEQIYDSLESIGNNLSSLGKPGGTKYYNNGNPTYQYDPFYQFVLHDSKTIAEPITFSDPTNSQQKLIINPDIILFFKLVKREGYPGSWWDESSATQIIKQVEIQNGNCEVIDIRTDYLFDYLKARQKDLLIGQYKHRRLFSLTQDQKDSFVVNDMVLGSKETCIKALFQNWGLRKDLHDEYLLRRLHLWFKVDCPEIDIDDPWAEEPPFDVYGLLLSTRDGNVAPGRWTHFRNKDDSKFQGTTCDFMSRVYFHQEVLVKYENTVGFDVEDNGSINCKHIWALNRSTYRHGNDLVSTSIGDFAEGVPLSEWLHWKQHETTYPTDEEVRALKNEKSIQWQITNLTRLLEQLNSSCHYLAEVLSSNQKENLWGGSMDSLAGKLLKKYYPTTAEEEEFTKRATILSTYVSDEMNTVKLRDLLTRLGKNFDKSFTDGKTLGSRKLLQRLLLICEFIHKFKPKVTEIDELIRISEATPAQKEQFRDQELMVEIDKLSESTFRLFTPLALLYDLRTFGGLAHPPKMDKYREAIQKFGFPSKDWSRKNYTSLIELLSQCFFDISKIMDNASEALREINARDYQDE